MNIIFGIKILDYNVQYYDYNDPAVIITLELQLQRLAKRIRYDNFWVIIFIIQNQEPRP